MFAIIPSLRCSIRQGFRTRAAIQAEILALRHQLLVLQRSARAHKVRLTASDRFLWVWLSRLWREWRSALVIVKPETVIAWHRRGFRLYWSWKSRHPQGRPSLSRELIDLIRRMSFGTVRPARMEFLVGTTVGAVRIQSRARRMSISRSTYRHSSVFRRVRTNSSNASECSGSYSNHVRKSKGSPISRL